MKKSVYRLLLAGAAAVSMLGITACSGKSGADGKAPANSGSGDSGKEAVSDIGFPQGETITLVVPGKAGGGSDLGIRYYSEGLNRLYGLKTTVTNYDSNTVGHQTVASAKPDGTTLTVATSALNIQYITGNAEVNPMKDFTLIACLRITASLPWLSRQMLPTTILQVLWSMPRPIPAS